MGRHVEATKNQAFGLFSPILQAASVLFHEPVRTSSGVFSVGCVVLLFVALIPMPSLWAQDEAKPAIIPTNAANTEPIILVLRDDSIALV